MALKYEKQQYLNYAGGLQVTTSAPLDIRTVVENVTALTTPATWYKDGDESTGISIVYNGLMVYVESEQCAYVCVDSTKVTNLTEGWKKLGSDVELSGDAVEIVKTDDNKYYESTDTAHENEITDSAVIANGAGHYLKLTIGQGDVIYVPTSNLVDLSNYYTKNEIDTKIAAINQFKYEVATALPDASKDTLYTLYLIPAPADSSVQQNVYDQYITVQHGETYSWEKIGDTRVDFTGINDRLDSIDSSIANINLSIGNINTSIGNINSSITNINTSIGNINTSINDIYALATGAITDIDTSTNTTLATLIENTSNNKSDITLTLSVSDGITPGTGLVTNTYVDQKFAWVFIDGGQTI